MKPSGFLAATIIKQSIAVAAALALVGGVIADVRAQDKAAPADRASRPLIRVPTALTLEEARVIIEAAKIGRAHV